MCCYAVYRTKEEQVADYLRERIISGVYPRGSRLKRAEIAEQLQLSITPVREALKLLIHFQSWAMGSQLESCQLVALSSGPRLLYSTGTDAGGGSV